MNYYLKGPAGTSDKSVVTAIAHKNGKVIFIKNKNDEWVSRHDAVENTLTAEGDIRLPIFLLGSELAAKLGYVIKDLGEQRLEIEVPDADTLGLKVGEINRSLKARGLEPVTYLPVRTGFVTIRETIDIILSAKGDYLVHFPYADNDLAIASHEASFHLGSILLNRKIVSRARKITEETQELLNIIEAHQNEFGPKYRRLMGQLRIERNFEMDAGLASMVTSPGFSRRDNDMKSYGEIQEKFTDRYWNYMLRNVEFLAHPKMQPFEAVLARLQLITGQDFGAEIKSNVSSIQSTILERAKVGTKVPLETQEAAALKKIVKLYVQKIRSKEEIGSSQEWLLEFIKGLDQRIKDLSDSLPETRH